MKYGLGLDLGSGSIGWAIVELGSDGTTSKSVYRLGVRRFDAGVSGDISSGRDESNAVERRQKRGPRRQHWRRAWRIRKVFRLLGDMGLLPQATSDSPDVRHQTILELDSELREKYPSQTTSDSHLLPYRLRALALDQALPAHALGRALYSVAQRRGFSSNRKAISDGDHDDGVVRRGIGELEAAINAAEARTLGEYFTKIDPEEVALRRRWTARRMYCDEFDAIIEAQMEHHSGLGAAAVKRLRNAFFDQRPLKSQRNLVGRCELEQYPSKRQDKDGRPKYVGRRRAMIGCLPFQEFRVLQKVNDLKFTEPDGTVRSLCDPDCIELRTQLIDRLSDQTEMTFGAIRKLFGFRKSAQFGRNYVFNFETDGDAKLIGNRTAAKISRILGSRWHALELNARTTLVDEILQFESADTLRQRLEKAYQFDSATASKLSKVVLEQGFGSLSRRAIRKLLPQMREGKNFYEAKQACYPNRNRKGTVYSTLPPFLDQLPEARSPAVVRVMSELRKVVNGLIREMDGNKPEWIRVELARDLKNSRKRRKDIVSLNRKNERAREQAAAKILHSMDDERYVTRENILKIRLAEECGFICPYTGDSIGMTELVGDEPQFEVEHIIPLSRSLDNSFLNKTLCKTSVNQKKHKQTPWEAFSDTAEYEAMLARVRRFKGDAWEAKLKRFMIQDIAEGDEFANRQLNETRYAARLATRYLSCLYGGLNLADESQRVFPTSGRITAYLRQRWQLNQIIGHADSKNRANHCHHAIDALVTALSTSRAVHQLAKAAERADEQGGKLFAEIDPPFPNLIEQTRSAVEAINVSSRVDRRIAGALHEETVLSHPVITAIDDEGNETTEFHVRKSLSTLSPGEVEQIVDDRIKLLVKDRLAAVGKPPREAFKDENDLPAIHGKNGRTTLIRRVKICKASKPIAVGSGSSQRYVAPGANHHMAIIAVLDGSGNEKKWIGDTVTRFEANQRSRKNEPVVQRDVGKGQRFKFSLCGGDHVILDRGDGDELCRAVVISGSNLEFVFHTNANPIKVRKKTPGERIRCSVSKLMKYKARKVDVMPNGTVIEVCEELK